jgi:hypothetical protein
MCFQTDAGNAISETQILKFPGGMPTDAPNQWCLNYFEFVLEEK